MEDNIIPEHHQSIFHQLFEHASDIDCKLLLLQQILELGDEKDIPLLEELESHENYKIREKASKTKEDVLLKLQIPAQNEHKRYPMNLCFIYDEFNIRPIHIDKDLDMDFEVTLDIFDTEE